MQDGTTGRKRLVVQASAKVVGVDIRQYVRLAEVPLGIIQKMVTTEKMITRTVPVDSKRFLQL